MNKDQGFDLTLNEYPVCPHCGHENCDPADVFSVIDTDSSVITDCPKCEKEYRVWRVVDVSYTTEKT